MSCMNNDETKTSITYQSIREVILNSATPINFDQLTADGVLEKKGARYKILDLDRLPEHASAKINSYRPDALVTFSKVTKASEKLARMLSK
jgi:hypothetical protein